ncbi:MAG: hypothetical protein DMG36_15875 [Acidobacteria bacterium]|nr:MAG: hypothetical protein DMG36_15875 [Acidobacteriota bacterium]
MRNLHSFCHIWAETAEVGGLKLHYLTSGHGPAVILLHGYTQTSRTWGPIIPLLADKFTVIAPDLRGIGDSDIPKDGLESTQALRISCSISVNTRRLLT